MKNKIEPLQIVRAYAAISVTLCHLYNDGWLPRIVNDLGGLGVDVFFALSGFIMGLTVRLNGESKIKDAQAFIVKRIKRIYPLYIICAIPLIAYVTFKEGTQHAFFYFGNLLLLPSVNDPDYRMALPVGWTLVYEMIFYVVISAFILLTRDRKLLLWGVLTFLAVLVISTNLLNWRGPQLTWVNLAYIVGDYRVLNFALGILAFFVYDKYKSRLSIPFAQGLIFLLILNIAVLLLLSWGISLHQFALAFSFLLVSAFSFVENAPSSNKFARKCVYLGDASYSIYLTHFYLAFFKPKFFAFFSTFIKDQDLLVNFLGMFLMVAAVIGGCIFYAVVEVPINAIFTKKTKSTQKGKYLPIQQMQELENTTR